MDVTLPSGTTYILVVDTDSYAGNFERELAGYATGICDLDRGHGDKEAMEAAEAEPDIVAALQAKSLAVRHDQYGMVTNTIRATPGRLNNGMGFNYAADDPAAMEDARIRSKQSMTEYQDRHLKEVRRRLAEEDFQPEAPGAWTREACERAIESAQASIDRAGEFVSWPAFESVAMFFSEPLTPDEMAFVRQRAEKFSSTKTIMHKPFKVLDVYQVEATAKNVETRIEE
jgi:hypothetical protein